MFRDLSFWCVRCCLEHSYVPILFGAVCLLFRGAAFPSFLFGGAALSVLCVVLLRPSFLWVVLRLLLLLRGVAVLLFRCCFLTVFSSSSCCEVLSSFSSFLGRCCRSFFQKKKKKPNSTYSHSQVRRLRGGVRPLGSIFFVFRLFSSNCCTISGNIPQKNHLFEPYREVPPWSPLVLFFLLKFCLSLIFLIFLFFRCL